MANFVLYFQKSNNYGYLLYDDLSLIFLGAGYNIYSAYNSENGILYVCKNGTPNTLVGIRVSDQSEQYSYNIPSNKLKPIFVDDQNRVWCIADPASKYIYIFDYDLILLSTLTLKVGNPLNDAIEMIAPTWDMQYFYLIYNAASGKLAKYKISNLNGGDEDWSLTCAYAQYIFTDESGYPYWTNNYDRIRKVDKDAGTQLWEQIGCKVGFYSQKTQRILIPVYFDVYYREYDTDGNLDGYSAAVSGYCYTSGIYPDVNEDYFYGFTSYKTVGGTTNTILQYLGEDWDNLESPVDGYSWDISDHLIGGDCSGYLNTQIRGAETMAEVSGRHLLAALKKGAAWNTDIQIGANDGFLFLSENLGILARESVPNESIGATDAFISCTDKLNTPADDKTIEFELIFEMFELMTALGLGTAGAPSAGTDGYTHTLRPARDLAGIYATFAKEPIDGSIMHVYPSIKVKGLEFSAAAGEIWKCTATVIASKFTNSPGVIVAGDFNNVTFRKKCGRIPFNACQIWMNAQSGDALATGDAIHPSSLNFSFMRELDAYHCSTNDTDCDAYAVQEPVENGYPEIKMTLEFPIFSADTYITAVHADTHYKMKINFVGALIGTDYYTWSVYFPNMELLNAEAAFDGAGKVVHPLEFRLKSVSSAPTGMSYGDPFYMTIINTISTNLLA